MNEKTYEKNLLQQREGKNDFFKTHPQSPIPMDKRHIFSGLAYYPANPSMFYEVELKEHENKKIITIGDNMGNQQQYLRWGSFQFEINGENVQLQAYKREQNEESLWLPFKDKTSGKETYGAGRYIDLDGKDKVKGKWIVDFNLAYNPYCAYSEHYVCPFIPPENWLQTEIKAGEKNYK
jgi:uncharacterized protein (DUF1684 family)